MSIEPVIIGNARLYLGDCRDVLAAIEPCSIDAVVTDPPYELGFMGKGWDSTGVAFRPETWAAVLRVLKPGGHLIALCGTRTEHRVACAIEDAGFEIRDRVLWLYGTGFPKSYNMHGEWEGWGTALKPAVEIGVLARKPLSEGTVAANVLRWGTGALNIDACRIPGEAVPVFETGGGRKINFDGRPQAVRQVGVSTAGRWPANVAHDGSDEVVGLFPESKGGAFPQRINGDSPIAFRTSETREARMNMGDSGSAARFFYCAKASKRDRANSKHPTVKPIPLMRWLVRMVTPPGGLVLDPFAGTGTTGQAALDEGFDAVLIERESEYHADIQHRLHFGARSPLPLFPEEAA